MYSVPSRRQKQKPKDKASIQSRPNPLQHERGNIKSRLLILTVIVINSGHSVTNNYYLQILLATYLPQLIFASYNEDFVLWKKF